MERSRIRSREAKMLGLRLRLPAPLTCSNKNGSVSSAAAVATAKPPYLLCFKSLSLATTKTSSSISSAEYLVSSLGLSPESALKIPNHRHIDLKSTTNAESVVSLFKDYGFSPSQMAKIFSSCPKLLSSDPHKNLKPKLDFFTQYGISHILTVDPSLLTRSLEKKIVPCFNFLMTFFSNNDKAIVSLFSLKHGTRVFRSFCESVVVNVEALRRYGVPDSNIVKLLLFPDSFLRRDTEQFNEILREIKEMGFASSSMMFVHGVRAFAGMSKDKWVSKMEVFKKSLGWTDQQVLALFVRQPSVMNLSEEKLKVALELFTKRLEWTAHDIGTYPSLLSCSIDKRILPRFSVLEILVSKSLVKKTCRGNAYSMSEDRFLRKFVRKYEDGIPQLLEIYQRKKMGC